MDQTTVTQTPIHTTESRVDPATTWHPVTRVGFRFAASYFSLYVLTTQMLYALLPFPIPSPGGSALVQNLTTKIATDLLGFRAPLVTMSGSGDKPFDWALALWLLTTAIVITIGWSVLDRRRVGYVTAHQWFRLFLRFSVGASLLSYGMAKVFPNQMPSPQLARLVEPYGHFSLMGVLWQQMGASAGYERFTGIVESLAGVF